MPDTAQHFFNNRGDRIPKNRKRNESFLKRWDKLPFHFSWKDAKRPILPNIQIKEETPVEEIARLMTAHKIRRLPVMRGKSLVGIVSRADIVGAIARGQHIALHTPVYDL